ncbi:hypothetical protein ACTA71_009745 [Dictyostelium dimigraforme]
MKILFFFLLILGIIDLSKSYSCNIEIGGYGFDLTPLRKADGYHKIISDYGDILYFNFCNTTIDTPCGNSALAYLFDGSNGECHSLGVQEFYTINAMEEKKTLLVNLRGGDIAYDSMVKMFEMFVVFRCDEDDDTSEPTLINTMEYGYASVIWPSKYACPTKTPNVEKLLLHESQSQNNYDQLEFENEEILNQFDNAAQSNAFEISNKNIKSPNEIMYNEITPYHLKSKSHLNNNNIEIKNSLPFLDKLNQMSQSLNNKDILNENNNNNENAQLINEEPEQQNQQQEQDQLQLQDQYQQQMQEQDEGQNGVEENNYIRTENAQLNQFDNDIKPIDMELPLFNFENDDELISQLNNNIKSEQDQNNFDTVSDDEIANQILDYINTKNDKIPSVDGGFIKEEEFAPNFIIEDSKPIDITDNFQMENGF